MLSPRSRRAHFLADLTVQVAHRPEGVEVQMPAVHERPHDVDELVRATAADGARLDPGVAFPLAALRDEVVLEHRQAHRERTAVAVGAQPHVDAEHVTVRREVVQRGDDACGRRG